MMRLTKQLLTLIILASSWIVCGAQSKPIVTVAPDGVIGNNDWKEFVSEEGRFSVLMPGVPAASVNERDTPEGKIAFHSFAVRLPEAFYQVGYSDFPAATDERILAGARQLITSQKEAEILSERQITMANHQATEVWLVQNKVAFGIRRIFVVQGRLYQINLLVPLERAFKNGRPSLKIEDQTQLFSTASSRFFNSVKLNEAAGESLGEVDTALRELTERNVVIVGAADPDTPVGKRITGGVLNGRAVKLVQPQYPAIARSAHASGKVSVQIIIDYDGNVLAAEVKDGHPLLWGASLKAARESKFTPTTWNGKPVMVSGIIIYNFVAQ